VGGHAGTERGYHVPPAHRSLAHKDESIVVDDAVVVRTLVLTGQRLASADTTRCIGANDLPSLRGVSPTSWH